MSQYVQELQLRGVPIWALRSYLEAIGAVAVEPPRPGATDPDGVVRPDGAMSGEGWQVVWRTERRRFHPRLPTEIEEHWFVFSASDESVLESAVEAFMLRAQRGGG